VTGARTREIQLDGAVIRLGQLLKYAGLADTGTDAKALLVGGTVLVNGELETRRGRQLHDGDEVRTGNGAVIIRLRPSA
jgi:ribosome-associated protein